MQHKKAGASVGAVQRQRWPVQPCPWLLQWPPCDFRAPAREPTSNRQHAQNPSGMTVMPIPLTMILATVTIKSPPLFLRPFSLVSAPRAMGEYSFAAPLDATLGLASSVALISDLRDDELRAF